MGSPIWLMVEKSVELDHSESCQRHQDEGRDVEFDVTQIMES